ncbi:MAG: 16S rRNA (cytosine(1402)-N(4))-methyltransferase RsmH [Candidatus Woesebacteria bacterium]
MKKTTPPQQLQHQPVLLKQTVEMLAPKTGETYLDLTAGYGGHAKVVIGKIGKTSQATLVDRDEYAITSLQQLREAGACIIKKDFASAAKSLAESGEQFDMILIDLGVSSPQLDNAERGFSIQRSGPLDMRMDQTQSKTAADIVNTYDQDKLVAILREYGEEPKAAAIARQIIASRPIKSTDELASVVAKAVRGKWSKTHPATRTFQAIRIELNDELGQIKDTLKLLPQLLRPGGRVAIISFHSLEDRLVKQFFKEQAEAGYEAELSLLTKKPISGATDDVHNPRARSAKLRAAVKIKTQQERA